MKEEKEEHNNSADENAYRMKSLLSAEFHQYSRNLKCSRAGDWYLAFGYMYDNRATFLTLMFILFNNILLINWHF